MKLNLGCGSQVPDGWTNVDYALGARIMKVPFLRTLNRRLRIFSLDWDPDICIHDLTSRFPWPDSSAEVVYSSHTLEHMSKSDGKRFLSECHRVLCHRGILRVVVPDLRSYVVDYTEGRVRADDFVEGLGVLQKPSKRFLGRLLAPFVQFPHRCMYDDSTLLEIIRGIGFEASTRAAFQSDIADIAAIELDSRTNNAVIVEGRKF